jgi:hypothetical protein
MRTPGRIELKASGGAWAMITPMMMSAPPASWIGASVWPKRSAARAIVQAGSIVLTRAAWAAPIRHRQPKCQGRQPVDGRGAGHHQGGGRGRVGALRPLPADRVPLLT